MVQETERTDQPSSGGPKRRYYRLTDFGRRVAHAEMDRMETLMDMARATNLLPSTRG